MAARNELQFTYSMYYFNAMLDINLQFLNSNMIGKELAAGSNRPRIKFQPS